MSTKTLTIEERKAEVLIELRKYKLIEKEQHEGAFAYIIEMPKEKEKAIVWCILGEATVGIAAMNTLYKLMKEKNLTAHCSHRRTLHPRSKDRCKKKNVELLPKSFPVFNIFDTPLCPSMKY